MTQSLNFETSAPLRLGGPRSIPARFLPNRPQFYPPPPTNCISSIYCQLVCRRCSLAPANTILSLQHTVDRGLLLFSLLVLPAARVALQQSSWLAPNAISHYHVGHPFSPCASEPRLTSVSIGLFFALFAPQRNLYAPRIESEPVEFVRRAHNATSILPPPQWCAQ